MYIYIYIHIIIFIYLSGWGSPTGPIFWNNNLSRCWEHQLSANGLTRGRPGKKFHLPIMWFCSSFPILSCCFQPSLPSFMSTPIQPLSIEAISIGFLLCQSICDSALNYWRNWRSFAVDVLIQIPWREFNLAWKTLIPREKPFLHTSRIPSVTKHSKWAFPLDMELWKGNHIWRILSSHLGSTLCVYQKQLFSLDVFSPIVHLQNFLDHGSFITTKFQAFYLVLVF